MDDPNMDGGWVDEEETEEDELDAAGMSVKGPDGEDEEPPLEEEF